MGFGPFDKKVLPDHPKVNMEFLPFKRLDLHKNNESSNIFSPISRQNLSRAKIVAKWMTKVVIEFCEKVPDSYLPIFPMWVQSLKYHVNFSVCLIILWEWCAYGSWPHMEIILLLLTSLLKPCKHNSWVFIVDNCWLDNIHTFSYDDASDLKVDLKIKSPWRD